MSARERSAPDSIVARTAARQHGVVSVRQLIEAGLTPDATKRRVAARRLHRVYRGVYAVGHTALGNEGRWMAAVMACGEGAVLSHRSATELWGLLEPTDGPVDVTITSTAGRRRREGIRLHRSPSLPVAETTRHNGIAVTTPARTIADVRRVASVDDVRRALREAEFKRMNLGNEGGVDRDLTRSLLERRFLRLCRRHRLPTPEVNVLVGPYEVDFLWRERSLIVEVDGYQAHSGGVAFEDDRAKDVALELLGYRVVRFTYRQVTNEPARVAAASRALLAAK